jgi:hypothetical protein
LPPTCVFLANARDHDHVLPANTRDHVIPANAGIQM